MPAQVGRGCDLGEGPGQTKRTPRSPASSSGSAEELRKGREGEREEAGSEVVCPILSLPGASRRGWQVRRVERNKKVTRAFVLPP